MWLNVSIVTMFQCPRDSNQREPSLADVPCTMNWFIMEIFFMKEFSSRKTHMSQDPLLLQAITLF